MRSVITQTYGAEGVLDKLPGCKGPHPNRAAPEDRAAYPRYSLQHPTHGPQRVSQELVHRTGEMVAFVGTLKGVGKAYLQTVIDCYSRYAFGRLYTSKMQLTAVHVLNNDVLPFSTSSTRCASRRSSPTTDVSTAADRTAIPSSCSCNSKGSSTTPRVRRERRRDRPARRPAPLHGQ